MKTKPTNVTFKIRRSYISLMKEINQKNTIDDSIREKSTEIDILLEKYINEHMNMNKV